MKAASVPMSLGQKIRDEEMWRVTRILNTRPSRRRDVSFVERYGNTRYATAAVPVATPRRARGRIRSLLP